MIQKLLFGGCALAALLFVFDHAAMGQLNLQYTIPQNGSPAPDPSLIDARIDDGPGSTTQGFQTWEDTNDMFLSGTLYSSTIDGRTVLRRKTTAQGGNNQGGIRTNGNMTTSAAYGGMPHGSNANTWSVTETNSISATGFRASLKVWLPDVANAPVSNVPIQFPVLGFDPADQFASNGAAFYVTERFQHMGFGVFTDANGEMVLYAPQKWSDYSANPSLYHYTIPDLTPNDGTRNNLHIIDMIVGADDDDTADYYVDGVAVPGLTNVQLKATTFANGAVQFGDCCGNVPDTEWAIEWMKVEQGVTTPHAPPEPPPGGVTGDYNGNGQVDAADYVLWRNGGPLSNDPTAGVQAGDYDVWKANFGKTSGAGTGTSVGNVPEPASALLLAVAGLLLIAFRRK